MSKKEYSNNDFCPICGQLVLADQKHICPEYILQEICKDEERKSREFDDDNLKTIGERLDDADFILNYYDEEDEEV